MRTTLPLLVAALIGLTSFSAAIGVQVVVLPGVAHARDSGYPSPSQIRSARQNTLARTIVHCYNVQVFKVVNGHLQRVAFCFSPKVLFCFRHRKPRAVFCTAMFHRIWWQSGTVDTFTKIFQWRVLRPVFGFLFAHEKPVNPWFYYPGV